MQGWLASTSFHLVLLVIFLIVSVEVETRAEEFSELLFLEMSPAQAGAAADMSEGLPVAAAPQQSEPSAAVRLPERRPAPLQADEVIPPTTRRESEIPRLDPTVLRDRIARSGQERPLTRQGSPTGNKEAPPQTGLQQGLVLPDRPASASGTGQDLPYLIQWIGRNRDIVRSVLPQYPSKVEKEVRLQFRFSVTPAGEVTAIRPLQKGEPALEEAAITALRQWKFQALPSVSPQTNQEAVITFRFKIRNTAIPGM